MELHEELIALDRAPREVAPFSQRYPGLTAERGYDAVLRLHADRLERGWKPVGWKIGFTNRTLWQRYGVHEPMWGIVYDRTFIEARNDAATVPLAGLIQPRIEPEICFKLKGPPRSPALADLVAAIDRMAHAVEIVQCCHPGWKVTISDCTAGNGLHGRLVVGSARPLAAPETLPLVEARLYKGAQLVDRGVGANVLGSPLLSLGHLVELLARRPDAPRLRAGDIVTTGVLTDAHPIAPGERWRTEMSGAPLPGLSIAFR